MSFTSNCLLNFSTHQTTRKRLGMNLSGMSLKNLSTYVKRDLKGNLTTPSIVGCEGNKNNPWYSQFDNSILRHGVTIKVGVNFKPKNLVEVLHFHKIQVQLNFSRICTPKIWERGISRKHLVLDLKKKKKKKKICNNPLDLQIWFVREGRAWDLFSVPVPSDRYEFLLWILVGARKTRNLP